MKKYLKKSIVLILTVLLSVNFAAAGVFAFDDGTGEPVTEFDEISLPGEETAGQDDFLQSPEEGQSEEIFLDEAPSQPEEEILLYDETDPEAEEELPEVEIPENSQDTEVGSEEQELLQDSFGDGAAGSDEILIQEELPEFQAAAGGEVTRGDWITRLVQLFEMTVEDDHYPDNYFSDIDDSSPYYYNVLLAVEFGVLDIEAGEAFHPADPATRDFAVSTLNYCLGFELEEGTGYTFADVSETGHPADAQVALDRGWLGSVDGKFMPATPITDTEAQKMLADAAEVRASTAPDENHENVYEFGDGIVVIPQGTPLFMDENGVLTVSDCPVPVKAGDKIAVYLSDIPQVFTVTAVEQQGNLLRISTREEDLGDALENVDAEGTEKGDLSQAVALGDSTVTYIVGGTEAVAYADGEEYISPILAGSKPIKAVKANKTIQLSNGVSVTLMATLSDLYVDYNIETSLSNSEVYVAVRGVSTITSTAKIDAVAAAGVPASIELMYIPISCVGGITVTADITLQGQVTLSYVGDFTTGFQFTSASGFRLVKSFSKKSFTVAAEITGSVGVTATAAIDKLPVVSGSIFAKVGINTKMTSNTYHDGKLPDTCVHIASWLFASAGASVTVDIGIKKWPFSKTLDIFTVNNSPVRVVYHYEDGRQVPKCTRDPHKYYTAWNSPYGSSGMRDGWSGVYGSSGETILPTYEYTLDKDDHATITKYNGNVSALIIPSTLDGHTVVGISSNVFKNRTSLYTVVIPDTVTTVGAAAFSGCTNLENLSLSKNLKTIGEGTFANCVSLSEIEIPKSLEEAYHRDIVSIARGSFEGSGLQHVNFEKGTVRIADGLFWGCGQLEQITIPETVTVIGDMAFKECTAMKNVIIPENVTRVESEAFYGCTSLMTVEMGNGITEIYSFAFQNCKNLSVVKLSKSLKTIGEGAFANCVSLSEIEIPKSLEEAYHRDIVSIARGSFEGSGLQHVNFEKGTVRIADGLFWGCGQLEQITIPETVTVIGDMAFKECIAMKNVIIPENVTRVESEAFYSCTSLTTVEMGNGITEIYSFAFQNCKNLSVVKLSKSLKTIGEGTFANCVSLSEIEIPKSLEEAYHRDIVSIARGSFEGSGLQHVNFEKGTVRIADGLFWGCGQLEQITIPETVTVIGDMAFKECSALKAITIPGKVQEIGDYVFEDCVSLADVTISDSVETMGNSVFSGCVSLKNVKLSGKCKRINSYVFSNCKNLTAIDLPDAVTYIGKSAFLGSGLTGISLTSQLQEIGNYAFSESMLEKVSFAEGIQSIGEGAFSECNKLDHVAVPDTVKQLGSNVFRECEVLKEVTLGTGLTALPAYAFYQCPSLEKIILPYRVTKINSSAFANCTAFKEIVIPRGVTSIADNVFSYPGRFTIRGVSGTYAEEYAKKNGINFVPQDIRAAEVRLSRTEATMERRSRISLAVTVRPLDFTDEVVWSTSDKSVATVADDGTVTAVSVGSAVITVKVGAKSASCKITVTDPSVVTPTPSVKVSSIKLNKTSAKICKGKTLTLKATVSPSNAANKKVTWKSSSNKIVVVDSNGKVTAKGYGKATVTAAAADGSGKTAKCTVTVGYGITYKLNGGTNNSKNPSVYYKETVSLKNPTQKGYDFKGWYTDSKFKNKITKITTVYKKDLVLYAKWVKVTVKVTQIKLNRTSAKLIKGAALTLKATVSPSNAANKKVTWKSSNSKIAAVSSSGKVTAKGYGKATITATAADGSKKTAKCTVTVGYGITYKLSGGTNNSKNPSVYYNETITLKNPSLKGFVFKGWYIDSKFKTKLTKITPKFKINLTLYAKWAKASVGKTAITSLKNSSGMKAVLKYKKVSGASGYEILYNTDKNFKKGNKKVSSTKTSVTLSKLTKGKIYYVKVRAYCKDSAGNKVYGKYSAVKKVKIVK